MILTVENLSKSYGEKTLFQDISFSIDEGDKLGIVGVNGTGKSTLVKVVAGVSPADGGNIIKSRGVQLEYLAQEHDLQSENNVITEVFKGSRPIMEVLRRYELALGELQERPEEEKLQHIVLECSQKIDELDGGWQIESDAKTILTRLGITEFTKKVGELSGGQQKRVALASALIQHSDLLILDEPTNHLDSETIEWLEDYLHRAKTALLMVTHDRYFLDNTATKILELDKGKAYIYTGNYSQFLELKAAREERAEAEERKRQNLLRTELAWMRRGAQARSTKQKARIERYEELKNRRVDIDNGEMEIGLGAARLGRQIIELENVSYQTPDGRLLIKKLDYTVLRNDRIGILGANGVGKSTLLNLIAGRLQPTEGKITIGQTVKIGYFSQLCENMDDTIRAVEYIKEEALYMSLANGDKISAVQLMERFLFPADLQWAPIGKLSGGEKRRLYLLRILMSEPNILLLDEPTNDLDIQTLSILEEFIDSFAGAILIVSHDRYFIDRLAKKVFVYQPDCTLRQYPGGYSDYKLTAEIEAEQELAKQNTKVEAPKNVEVRETERRERKKKLSFREKKEYDEIEAVIASVEGELSVVRKQLQQGSSDYTFLEEISKREVELAKRLDELVERWSYLEELAENE